MTHVKSRGTLVLGAVDTTVKSDPSRTAIYTRIDRFVSRAYTDFHAGFTSNKDLMQGLQR